MNEAVYELFVPGRLCILGEHSDWAAKYRTECAGLSKGFAVVCTTNQGIYARCKAMPTASSSIAMANPSIVFESTNHLNQPSKIELSFAEDRLEACAREDPFFGYVAGTVLILLRKCKSSSLNIPLTRE
jgi:galactokinase